MASPASWKCLSRPAPIQLASAMPMRAASAAFSTSSASFASPLKKPLTAAQKKLQQRPKGVATLRIKKKAVVKTGKPPMPGERKAMRKRVVLSNTNALEVEGLQDLSKNMVGDKQYIGKVLGLQGQTVDGLRAVEAFKAQQGWGLFRRPGVLVREETVKIGERLNTFKTNGVPRLVLDGNRGAGKSLMLLSSMAMAFVKGWIVVNFPEAQELTNAVTEYAPIPDTPLYSQNAYTATLLAAIAKANSTILDKLEISQKHLNVPIPLQSNITLSRLCELGARDPEIAWPIFEAFWSEITASGRPPILMGLDGLQYIMTESEYHDANFKQIHAHDFAIIQHFVSYLSGEKSLPNGGAILAATSRSHAPKSKSVELALQQALERQHGGVVIHRNPYGKENYTDLRAIMAFRDDPELTEVELFTEKDPWEKTYDVRAEKALSSVEVLKLGGLSKDEARGLMEYWAQSGVLRQRVDERTVAEKWALAGNGIVGEIERGALRTRI